MTETGRGAIEARHGVEPLWRLRWRFRLAIVRGRIDMHNPRRKSVRAAIERHLSHQNPKKIERRFLEFRRRHPLVKQWVLQGIPHAERVVRVEGLRHLEEALSGGVGTILASAHFGHGRLIKPVLGIHGSPALLVGALGRSGKWPPIASEDLPVTLNLRPHFAALQENKPLIILVDGLVSTSLSRIPVRGITVNFAPGAMRIACAAGAPVLPTFVVDEGTLRDPLAIRLVIHAPLALQSSDDAAADGLENLRRFAAIYGEELDRNPHNINWRWVRPESGEWRPPPTFPLGKLDRERMPDFRGGSGRAWPGHGL